MSATTPVYALPYLELSDAPNIAAGLQALAQAVEATLIAGVGKAKGVVAMVAVGTSADLTTETITASATFTAEANRCYRVSVTTPVVDNQGSGAQTGIVTLRHAAGATVDATGTLIGKGVGNTPASTASSTAGSAAETMTVIGWINGAPAGQRTVGVGLAPSSGATAVRFLQAGTTGPDFLPSLVIEDCGTAV